MSVTVGTTELRRDGLVAFVEDAGRFETRGAWIWMFPLAIAIHLAVLWGSAYLRPAVSHAAAAPVELEYIEAPAVESTPPPATDPEPEARPAPPRHEASPQPPSSPPPAPDERAQAGKVFTAPDEAQGRGESDEVVSGESDRFAGGTTAASGTASHAVAPPPPPPPPVPPATPPPAPTVDTVAATRAYLGRVRQALVREKRYPMSAQRLGIEGTVVVSFSIGPTGAFSGVSVVASSGNDLLDQAALATVGALSGRIPRPAETGAVSLPLRTSLQFAMSK